MSIIRKDNFLAQCEKNNEKIGHSVPVLLHSLTLDIDIDLLFHLTRTTKQKLNLFDEGWGDEAFLTH